VQEAGEVRGGEGADTGVVAGTVLVVPLPDADDEPGDDIEIGWHFHPDPWGQGYAAEAARAALERTFAGGVEGVYAVVHPGNDRSVAVTRRLGMTPLGIQTRWHGGTPFQTYVRRAGDGRG
jgi:RimJ/RimL family protein N-acetyltransferase